MFDRQRAFVCALVYVVRNHRFHSYHSIGVKRLPDAARMYDFRGEWLKDSLSIQDDKYNKVIDREFLSNPYGVKVQWIGHRRTAEIKAKISPDESKFWGHDADYYRFEGVYYPPSDKVEIRDTSTDKYKYVYRIVW